MICLFCHGRHWVVRSGQMAPCPECGGLGEVHCCDGLVAQVGAGENISSCVAPRGEESLGRPTALPVRRTAF